MRWVVTSAGRRMPIDPTPDEKGLLVVIDGVAMFAKDAGPDANGAPRFTSHFATCPSAATHRKKS